MDAKEKEFNVKVDAAFDALATKYRPKFQAGGGLTGMIKDNELHGALLKESSDMVADIANGIYDEASKEVAVNLCQQKLRTFLPVIKKLRGL